MWWISLPQLGYIIQQRAGSFQMWLMSSVHWLGINQKRDHPKHLWPLEGSQEVRDNRHQVIICRLWKHKLPRCADASITGKMGQLLRAEVLRPTATRNWIQLELEQYLNSRKGFSVTNTLILPLWGSVWNTSDSCMESWSMEIGREWIYCLSC